MSVSSDVSTRVVDGLRRNEALWECLHRLPALQLSAWYLGAGCVAQTIWNLTHGKAPSADKRFGYRIQPYQSTEDAIGTWPTTATAIGVRPSGHELEVWAPFGTDDLFNLVVRPNRVQITPAIYDAKVTRWVAHWPSLEALSWEEGVGRSGLRHPDAAIR